MRLLGRGPDDLTWPAAFDPFEAGLAPGPHRARPPLALSKLTVPVWEDSN
jgi:hypothetical protein